MSLILPVIHYLDKHQAIDQGNCAFEAGADGVFMITHHGNNEALLEPLEFLQKAYPQKLIGVNFLGLSPIAALRYARYAKCDNLWLDNPGITSAGIDLSGREFYEAYCTNPMTVFASVAFKYQRAEQNPAEAARIALSMGYIPTTSGPGTGYAPDLNKIKAMSAAVNGKLAVASGMTPENITSFAPYLSHILVATGVSLDEHHFDFNLLMNFISNAHTVYE